VAKATPIEDGPSAPAGTPGPAPVWVMITSVWSAGRCLLNVKRVLPSGVCWTPPLIAGPPPGEPGPPGGPAGVNQESLQALPGGRYWTTAGTPASSSSRCRPAASDSELISTVTVPSSFVLTA
jgi:hypothetical protein